MKLFHYTMQFERTLSSLRSGVNMTHSAELSRSIFVFIFTFYYKEISIAIFRP